MKLREEILKEHSKAQCTKIVKWVGSNQQRFDELFDLFLNDEYRVVQRTAWPIGFAVMAVPALIQSHWQQLISKLREPGLHDAEAFHGDVMDICFSFLESPKEAMAIKAFSMTVVANMAKHYPEIKTELRLIIEDQLPHQTAGFKSRAKKILKQLERL